MAMMVMVQLQVIVRIFNWDGVRWNQVGGDIDGEFSGDNSGSSVSINGEGRTISISSTENGSNAGHVRLFSILDICPKPLNITILPNILGDTTIVTACDSTIWKGIPIQQVACTQIH